MKGAETEVFCEWEGLLVKGKGRIVDETVREGSVLYDLSLSGNKLVKAVQNGARKIYFRKGSRLLEEHVTYVSGSTVCVTEVRPTAVDERQHLRVSVPLSESDCRVKFPDGLDWIEFKGRVLDISEGGIGIVVEKKALPYVKYEAELVVVWNVKGRELLLPAKIKNYLETEQIVRLGCQFVSLGELERKFLVSYLSVRQRELARLLS